MLSFKQLFSTLVLLCLSTTIFAQVKVGDNPTTINPSSVLEVESITKGLLLPRMTQAQRDAIASPAQGLMVYNTTVPCLQVNDGTPAAPEWNCISGAAAAGPDASTNGTGIVSSYGGPGCTGTGTINGTMTEGVAVSGVTMTLYANVIQLGTWDLEAIENGVTFTGTGTFTTLGCQPITLNATGTPTAAGPFTWSTNTTPAGSGSATVAPAGNDLSTNGTGIVSAYGGPGCTGTGTINGTMTEGVAVSGVTMTLYANVTQLGTWDLEAVENGVTFTGTGSFTTLGCQPITLTATGTPTAAGPFTWNTNTTPAGSGSATVAGAFDPATITSGTGTFLGKTCFDIARGNDDVNACDLLVARLPNQADFTQATTHTQSYTFTPTGTVSNVRFYYVNAVGNGVVAISGGNAGDNISSTVTATVNYNTDNNTLALGLTNSNPMQTKIYAVYNINSVNNNNPADDRVLELTANIKDCTCCYVKISPTEYKAFLCHNLGADNTIDPHTPVHGLVGAYQQFGKRGPSDVNNPASIAGMTGDSRNDWQIYPNRGSLGFAAAPTATNQNTGDIASWTSTGPTSPFWNAGTEAAPVKTVHDPCPTGYRVPTAAEIAGMVANNVLSQTGTFVVSTLTVAAIHVGPDSFNKLVTFVSGGRRANNTGAISGQGYMAGGYWTSTRSGSTSRVNFYVSGPSNAGAPVPSIANAGDGLDRHPMNIRCIAE